jgi:hypothetical protein
VGPYRTDVPSVDLSPPKPELYKWKKLSDRINQSSISEIKIEHLTSSRFAARIGKLWVVVSQSLPTAKGVNPP